MKYRTYRNTDLTESEVGFGMWTVFIGWWGSFTEQEAVNLMRRAFDLEITFYDAADTWERPERRVDSKARFINLAQPFRSRELPSWVVKHDSARTVHPFECSAPSRFDPGKTWSVIEWPSGKPHSRANPRSHAFFLLCNSRAYNSESQNFDWPWPFGPESTQQ